MLPHPDDTLKPGTLDSKLRSNLRRQRIKSGCTHDFGFRIWRSAIRNGGIPFPEARRWSPVCGERKLSRQARVHPRSQARSPMRPGLSSFLSYLPFFGLNSCSSQASSSCHPSGLTPGRSEWLRRMTGRKKPYFEKEVLRKNLWVDRP